jgi:protein-arginine kinase activator protein McsA
MINKIIITRKNIIELSGDLVDFYDDSARERRVCPNCGYEFGDFDESGRLGCSVCYDTFREQIKRSIAEWN